MTLPLILVIVASASAAVSWAAAMGVSSPARACTHPLVGFDDGTCRSCGTVVFSCY